MYTISIYFRSVCHVHIEEKQQEAVKEVSIYKRSCRGVTADYDIKPTTLRRYCTVNQEKLDGGQEMNIEKVGYTIGKC